jgi:hypothetical protein
VPRSENGQAEFEAQTGINIESDIDSVVASLQPQPDGSTGGLVIARGRFSDVKIEALMREHGAQVEEYNGNRIIAQPDVSPGAGRSIALTFLEPGLVAVGSGPVVRAAIDLQKSGDNVTKSPELMALMHSLDRGNAWAIGRVDALKTNGRLPEQLASQLPAITWFSVSSRVDTDIQGTVRADARDDEAANNLREVVRGFLALVKLQAGSRPELQTLVRSLELGGTGKTVAVTFSIPGAVLDAFIASHEAGGNPLAR